MKEIYSILLGLIFVFAIIVFVLLFYVSAPYGKFMRKGWGPSIKSGLAWMIMELPSPVLMVYFYLTAESNSAPAFIFFVLWLLHYLHRTFYYSFTQSGREKPYPVLIAGMAFIFNCLNGFANGYGVFHLLNYSSDWFFSWQFIAGITIFLTGFVINKTADEKLRRMRRMNKLEYVKPEGWMFEYVSSPHYFGEIIEWLGWAVMTWSLPGFAFFIFTFANLFPRGIISHRWYRQKFKDYPLKRKAVIPFVI